jgi:uncharacterized membrane protein
MAPTSIAINNALAAMERRGQQLRSRGSRGTPRNVWIIVVAVLGTVLLLTAVAIAVVYIRKRRKYAQAAREEDPILPTKREMSHRRNMSAADRTEAEELERTMMIRKSLASRSSSWGSLPNLRDSRIMDGARLSRLSQVITTEEVAGDEAGRSLGNDWKEWEAHTAGERPISGLQDPGIQGHPALTPELDSVPNPTLSRSSLPSQRERSEARISPPSLHRTSILIDGPAVESPESVPRAYMPVVHAH